MGRRPSSLPCLRRHSAVRPTWSAFDAPAMICVTCPQVGGFRLESPYLAYAGGGLNSDTAPHQPTDNRHAAGCRRRATSACGTSRLSCRAPSKRSATCRSRASFAAWRTHRRQLPRRVLPLTPGVRLVTHMFDTFVLPVMTEPGAYPAGLVDYLLVEDRVTCEIIADGTHVHPLLVEKGLALQDGRSAGLRHRQQLRRRSAAPASTPAQRLGAGGHRRPQQRCATGGAEDGHWPAAP